MSSCVCLWLIISSRTGNCHGHFLQLTAVCDHYISRWQVVDWASSVWCFATAIGPFCSQHNLCSCIAINSQLTIQLTCYSNGPITQLFCWLLIGRFFSQRNLFVAAEKIWRTAWPHLPLDISSLLLSSATSRSNMITMNFASTPWVKLLLLSIIPSLSSYSLTIFCWNNPKINKHASTKDFFQHFFSTKSNMLSGKVIIPHHGQKFLFNPLRSRRVAWRPTALDSWCVSWRKHGNNGAPEAVICNSWFGLMVI